MLYQANSQPARTRGRRRRFSRPLNPFGLIPDYRTAAALDDQQAAEGLIGDLLALVEAGLIAPVRDHDTVRYAPTDPDSTHETA